MTLSPVTIPTIARGAVRAFVKSLPGFEAWCQTKGIASRDAKNADLIDFAGQCNELSSVLAIIAKASGQPVFPVGPASTGARSRRPPGRPLRCTS